MAFEPAVLEGGYVTDLLLTVAFDGEAWEEAHIGELRAVRHAYTTCHSFLIFSIHIILSSPDGPPTWCLRL